MNMASVLTTHSIASVVHSQHLKAEYVCHMSS